MIEEVVAYFGAKFKAWRHKLFHNFHFLQPDMGAGIIA